jgi:hypothetical protein
MTAKTAELVKRIGQLEELIAQSRRAIGAIADERAQRVRELKDLVGGQDAADLLGISRSRVYKLLDAEAARSKRSLKR